MKAAVYRKYGSPGVLAVDDVPKPAPRDDEILVRSRAATVGVVDSLARQGAVTMSDHPLSDETC